MLSNVALLLGLLLNRIIYILVANFMASLYSKNSIKIKLTDQKITR